MNPLHGTLNTIRQILGWCILIGFFFVLVWFAAFVGARDLIVRQGAWFGLTPHECALMAYGGIGLAKILVIVFFLTPFLAIRLACRRR